MFNVTGGGGGERTLYDLGTKLEKTVCLPLGAEFLTVEHSSKGALLNLRGFPSYIKQLYSL